MLSSRDIFTLLVVEKNGKKRLVVCGGGWVVFLWASRFRRASGLVFAFPHVSPRLRLVAVSQFF